MALKSYAEMAEEVQAAISAILGGAQSYSIGNRSLTRANLKELLELEKHYRSLASREAAGGIQVRGVTPVL